METQDFDLDDREIRSKAHRDVLAAGRETPRSAPRDLVRRLRAGRQQYRPQPRTQQNYGELQIIPAWRRCPRQLTHSRCRLAHLTPGRASTAVVQRSLV